MPDSAAQAGFSARTQTPSQWKAVTAAIQTLVEEATFEVNPDGITFRAMDPSHVALVDLFWPNADFQKFTCEKSDKFTVRMEDFAKLIRRAESKDSVEISREGTDSLSLKLSNGYKREFELHLIESSASTTPLPKLNYESTFVTTEPAFDRILNDVSAISNHITIETAKDKVIFSGKGDTGRAAIELTKPPDKAGDGLIDVSPGKESKATYSIEYLLKITKAAGSASDTILFEYSSKMPLRMGFKLGENSKGHIQFYLAPRVQE
jgi:proliferating cell nuclear antigen